MSESAWCDCCYGFRNRHRSAGVPKNHVVMKHTKGSLTFASKHWLTFASYSHGPFKFVLLLLLLLCPCIHTGAFIRKNMVTSIFLKCFTVRYRCDFQIAKGMVPPQLTICNYQPFSVPVMWNIAHNTDTFPKLQIFNTIIATIDGLRQIRHSLENTRNGIQEQGRRRQRSRHKRSGDSDLLGKLIYIKGELGRKPLTFTLLRNIHNTTFDQIFDELGPSLEDTIRYCTNAGITCANITKIHSALFPKCFVYSTQENKSNVEVSDEGIDNGVSLVLNSGVQLAAKAFNRDFYNLPAVSYNLQVDRS